MSSLARPVAVVGVGYSELSRKGEPNPVDVAFKSAEVEGEAKVSTLKRLMGALKKL